MPKPIAYVTWSSDSRSGRVSIETPETDTDRAHRAQVVAAVMVASSGWGAVDATRRDAAVVSITPPHGWHVSIAALYEAVRYRTRYARDAAKAALRDAGYIVGER